MADKKITDLTELTEVASDDYLEIVDTSANASKKITRENLIAGHDHDSDYLGISAKAADSDKLDGIDSTGFATAEHNHDAAYLGISAKAADSDKLDGLDSTAFGRPVFLTTPLTSSSWLLSSGGRSNTSSTLIDLSSVFDVPAGVKAVLVRLVVRDSGAFPQDEKYVSFGPSSTYYYALSCYALGGDYQSSNNGIIPCDSNGDIYYRVVASGTGTMDVNLEIWGYWR